MSDFETAARIAENFHTKIRPEQVTGEVSQLVETAAQILARTIGQQIAAEIRKAARVPYA